ncbi:MAG TPA: hypothetical protein VHN14_11175, partial [Kofleriaceae bacterium]|nr:hypothetical protein [Kofleriaceae bacterium]
MGDDEELVVQILVAEGILSADEVRELSRAAARDGQVLLDRLRADGRVSEPTLASLRARMNGADPAKLATGPTALALPKPRTRAEPRAIEARPAIAEPGDDGEPDQFPVPNWDRYEPIRLLGQGGMGRVFLARDLRLGREVAIKFMRGEEPELARRIVAEARAQARVNHDRVCKVYEVGEV